MHTVKFISSSELELAKELFSLDSRLIGEPMELDEIDQMLSSWKILLDDNKMRISMIFSETNEPLGMYTGVLFPEIRGWWVGATKVKYTTNHFAKSARLILPAGEALLDELESLGYYKFWMAAPEIHHNIRNTIMKKYSERLNRYEWFDEYIIPQGSRTPDIPIFNVNRKTCTWSDVLVRMFVLKQEFRKSLVINERKKQDV